MSHASADPQTCTSNQAINIFGIGIGNGQLLQIGHDEAKARSASFTELHEAFKRVAPADAKAWLLQNGAVVVLDGGPVTQTIRVVSRGLSYLVNCERLRCSRIPTLFDIKLLDVKQGMNQLHRVIATWLWFLRQSIDVVPTTRDWQSCT